MKSFEKNAKFQIAWRAQVLKSSKKIYMKKMLGAWCTEVKRLKKNARLPMAHGSALVAANRWLHLSFAPMMKNVWAEFPL